MNRPDLTEDELLCLLSAGLSSIATAEAPEEAGDLVNLRQLRDACAKLARAVGMDQRTLAEFAQVAAGKAPGPELIRVLNLERPVAGAPLGATGEHPRGRLNPHDEGELSFTVGSDRDSGTVILDWGKPVAWVGMQPDQADTIAQALQRHARRARKGAPRRPPGKGVH